MLKYYSTVIPLYAGTRKSSLKIIIADEKGWDKAMIKINSFNDEEETFFEYNNISAFATMTGKNGVNHFWMVFTDKRCSIDTIAHECTHVKNYIFVSRGLELDRLNDEAEAYLMGWLTSECYKRLKKFVK